MVQANVLARGPSASPPRSPARSPLDTPPLTPRGSCSVSGEQLTTASAAEPTAALARGRSVSPSRRPPNDALQTPPRTRPDSRRSSGEQTTTSVAGERAAEAARLETVRRAGAEVPSPPRQVPSTPVAPAPAQIQQRSDPCSCASPWFSHLTASLDCISLHCTAPGVHASYRSTGVAVQASAASAVTLRVIACRLY